MRSSTMTHRFGALSATMTALACVVLFHSAARAQQPEAAAKDAAPAKGEPANAEPGKAAGKAEAAPDTSAKPMPPQNLPPEYGPPPGYGDRPMPPQPPGYYDPYSYGGPPPYPPPPPPRYYHPYRRYYQPAPPPRYYFEPLTYRPFFFGFGLGVGGVGILPSDTATYSNQSSAGLGYNLRFGFGVSPRWSIVLSADGAQAYFNGSGVSETAWTIGPQVFITRQLYARAGLGAATYSQDETGCDAYGYCYDGTASDSGIAAAGALGFEFLQSYHTALALEAVGTIAKFSNDDKVSTFGVNFVLNLF